MIDTTSKFFEGNDYFVDEKVNFFKFSNEYKVYNEKAEQIGLVKQQIPLHFKLLSLLINKGMMPFTLEILDIDNQIQAKISRGWTFWMSKIVISSADGNVIAFIRQKFRLLKPKFEIIDTNNNLIAVISGDWKAWNFMITDTSEKEIGSISKKWGGIAKEMFTSADKYNVSIKPDESNNVDKKIAILSTAITVDMILKEKNG